MAFKVVLTCLFAVATALTASNIDQPREPITGWEALAGAVFHGLCIYGLWAWI